MDCIQRDINQYPYRIHGTGIFTYIFMVDFYGFHVGKYTVRPMDRMGYASSEKIAAWNLKKECEALTLSPYKGSGLFNVTMCNPLKVKPLTGNFGKWCLGCGSSLVCHRKPLIQTFRPCRVLEMCIRLARLIQRLYCNYHRSQADQQEKQQKNLQKTLARQFLFLRHVLHPKNLPKPKRIGNRDFGNKASFFEVEEVM